MRLCLTCLTLFYSTLSPVLSNCYGGPPPTGWSKDERLVLRNVAAGKLAEFDEHARGVLTPNFLQALLTDPPKEIQGARYILLKHARVTGDLDLSYQEAKPYISLKDVVFEGDVDFSWSSFAKGLNLSFGDFKRNVTFRGMEVQGPFRCIDATFRGEKSDIRSLRANHVVDFAGATFHPEAVFAYSRAGSMFYCDKAVFHQRARFDHMRVDGDASFSDVQFDGPVRFENSHVNGDFILDRTLFNLEQAPADGDFIDMTNLAIKGTFHFTPKKWPQQGIRQSGIQYASWAPPNLDPLELLKGADYDPQVYTNLENILRTTGQIEKADNVGMARKSEERSRLKWSDASFWWSLLLWLFVGDGYHPGWALAWSVGIILLGAALFQKRCMVAREADAEKQGATSDHDYGPKYRYSPIWYSLDLFVPAINLEAAEFWVPARDQRFLLFWMRIQRILGWIIIPIGLLAISGIAKP